MFLTHILFNNMKHNMRYEVKVKIVEIIYEKELLTLDKNLTNKDK